MPNLMDRVRENGLQQTAVEVVGGRWYRERNDRIAHIIDVAYQRGPALVPTPELLKRLAEVDPHMVDLLTRMQGWNILASARWGTKIEFNERDRLRVVWESRYFYHFDVQMGNAVDMWTDFGFGQAVKIVPEDEGAREVWQAFWDNPRNRPLLRQRKLAQQSNDLVRDGEFFYEFTASGVDGSTTIRRVYTEEITEILYEDEDRDVPLFYVRRTDEGNVYYPDWQAKRYYADKLDDYWTDHVEKGSIPRDARRADDAGGTFEAEVNGGMQTRRRTDVVMQQIAANETNGRGWPILRRAVAWANSLKQFLEDRATVARAVAAFVDEVIVTGGSRGIDAVKDKFASSLTTGTEYTERRPAPAPGSILMHNEANEWRRRPLTTGAGDAEADAMLMVGQVSAGTKIPPHWMGFPGAMQNRATARESSRPFDKQMERYQTTWVDVFKEWVEIVLWFAQQYSPGHAAGFETTDAVVTLETPLDLEMEDVTKLMNAVTAAMTDGALDQVLGTAALSILVRKGLEDLGVREVVPAGAEEPKGQGGSEPQSPDGEPQEPEEPEEPGNPAELVIGTLARLQRTMRLNSLREALVVLGAALDKEEEHENVS
jgi:hypothetical protein